MYMLSSPSLCVQFRTNKLIYRRYAGLFFTICCDVTDNELVTLEAIHLFVEILDQYFQNVCELDLVFNFHKVYLILDEFIIGGEFQETSKKVRLCVLAYDTTSPSHARVGFFSLLLVSVLERRRCVYAHMYVCGREV